jgi:hypothetical protein
MTQGQRLASRLSAYGELPRFEAHFPSDCRLSRDDTETADVNSGIELNLTVTRSECWRLAVQLDHQTNTPRATSSDLARRRPWPARQPVWAS